MSTSAHVAVAIAITRAPPATPARPCVLSSRAAAMPAQAVPWFPVGLPSGTSDDAFQDSGCSSRSG
jgi:hypothetical protein